MSAPTETELSAAITAALGAPDETLQVDTIAGWFHRVAIEAAEPLVNAAAATIECGGQVWEPLAPPEMDALWVDLRPSEAVELRDAIQAAAIRIEARCEAIVLEELVAVGLTFGAAHPDAERPVPS